MNPHHKLIYWLAFADGVALLALVLIAVPLKYVAAIPLGVKLLGPLHGGLFLTLNLSVFTALAKRILPPRLAALLFFGALIPLGAFYADRQLRKTCSPS